MPRKPRKGRGQHLYGRALSAEDRARIWTLAETGLSLRGVAEQTGISVSAVAKVVGSEPDRLSAIRDRLREERSASYRQLEARGQEAALAWLAKSIEQAKRPLHRITDKTIERLRVVPRLISAAATAASHGTRGINLLTGEPTERYAVDATQQLMDAEQLVDYAIHHNKIDQLPPRWREVARAKQAQQAQWEQDREARPDRPADPG